MASSSMSNVKSKDEGTRVFVWCKTCRDYVMVRVVDGMGKCPSCGSVIKWPS
jgi:Zn finger protein HypA/HybF involved in hydrogenase expression